MSEAKILPSQRKAQPAYESGVFMFSDLFREKRCVHYLTLATELKNTRSWPNVFGELVAKIFSFPNLSSCPPATVTSTLLTKFHGPVFNIHAQILKT